MIRCSGHVSAVLAIISSLQQGKPYDMFGSIVICPVFRCGYAVRFKEDQVRLTSRYSRGVRAVTLRQGDRIADFDVIREEDSSKGKLSITIKVSFTKMVSQLIRCAFCFGDYKKRFW